MYILLSTDCNALFLATGAMSPDDISLTGSFDFMDELTEVESMGFPDREGGETEDLFWALSDQPSKSEGSIGTVVGC